MNDVCTLPHGLCFNDSAHHHIVAERYQQGHNARHNNLLALTRLNVQPTSCIRVAVASLGSPEATSTTSSTRTTRTSTHTSHTSTSMTTTTTAKYPPAGDGFECNMFLGPVKHAEKKGIALDDTTFSECPQLTTKRWPNAKEKITSLRLFKAWDEKWSDHLDRLTVWKELKNFIQRGNNVKVLYGTQISCNETADDLDWIYIKELMFFIGREHVMGLAIGNEVELLHTQDVCDKKCAKRLFHGGYFYKKVMHRANDLAVMQGFQDVTLTTVMGGYVLGGSPFVNSETAGVLDFFQKINRDFGTRWAWSWNTYPYFDPHIVMDEGIFHTCNKAMMAAINFAPSSMLPGQLRELRRPECRWSLVDLMTQCG
ncbi:unnamed protein product [Effrenium voratum]|uniref:Uncharacterized protein n=1 Tax=Effrenium voratum TaxID=2562239 RepID=A0AA36MJM0_9DINO|nr:unnamed protein product [Effrenium voratum]